MKIDNALILCAGFGTRMGPIGEVLPKPLWPVFEKTLLELQIRFVKELGCKKIFINAHHRAQDLREFVQDLNHGDVELVFEPEILGTGGAVHSIASKLNYQGSFLYLAADQFYFFDQSYLLQALDLIKEHPVALFGLEFDKESSYAGLEIENGLLKNIIKQKVGPGVTFSGMALVDLAQLKKSSGYSGFFESVCRYQEDEIPVVMPEGEYVDWGSGSRYYRGMFDLLKGTPESFYKFCSKWGAFDQEKMNQGFYGPSRSLINLTASDIDASAKAIVLKKGAVKVKKNGLYFENIIDEFPV